MRASRIGIGGRQTVQTFLFDPVEFADRFVAELSMLDDAALLGSCSEEGVIGGLFFSLQTHKPDGG